MTLNSLMRTVSAGALLAATILVSAPGAHAQASGGNGGWFVPKAAHPDALRRALSSAAFRKLRPMRKKTPHRLNSSRLRRSCRCRRSRLPEHRKGLSAAGCRHWRDQCPGRHADFQRLAGNPAGSGRPP